MHFLCHVIYPLFYFVFCIYLKSYILFPLLPPNILIISLFLNDKDFVFIPTPIKKHPLSFTGVMAARGILENPAMYAGYESTPLECVKDFVNIALSTGTSFSCFHHHLIYMLEKSLSRSERRYFNVLGSTSGVINYLNEKYMMEFYSEFYYQPFLLGYRLFYCRYFCYFI